MIRIRDTDSNLIISVSESTQFGLVEKLKANTSKTICIYESGADLGVTAVSSVRSIIEKFKINDHYFLYVVAIMSDIDMNIETTMAAIECVAERVNNVDLVLANKAQRSDEFVKLMEN